MRTPQEKLPDGRDETGWWRQIRVAKTSPITLNFDGPKPAVGITGEFGLCDVISDDVLAQCGVALKDLTFARTVAIHRLADPQTEFVDAIRLGREATRTERLQVRASMLAELALDKFSAALNIVDNFIFD